MNIQKYFAFSAAAFLSILCNGDLVNNTQKCRIHDDKTCLRAERTIGEVTNRVLKSSQTNMSETAGRIGQAEELDANTSANNISTDRMLMAKFKLLWPLERWKQYGYFDEDYLELINVYWLQFSPPPELVQKVLGGVYVIFSTGGCLGNLIVLFMYVK